MRPAITAGNGECLWEIGDAIDVVGLLTAQGLGVVGCEIYERHRVGWGTFLDWWDVDPPRAPGEGWHGFVERAARYTLARLGDQPVPRRPGAGNGRLYFLAAAREEQFGRLTVVDPDRRIAPGTHVRK